MGGNIMLNKKSIITYSLISAIVSGALVTCYFMLIPFIIIKYFPEKLIPPPIIDKERMNSEELKLANKFIKAESKGFEDVLNNYFIYNNNSIEINSSYVILDESVKMNITIDNKGNEDVAILPFYVDDLDYSIKRIGETEKTRNIMISQSTPSQQNYLQFDESYLSYPSNGFFIKLISPRESYKFDFDLFKVNEIDIIKMQLFLIDSVKCDKDGCGYTSKVEKSVAYNLKNK
jgi:hypothetical protein